MSSTTVPADESSVPSPMMDGQLRYNIAMNAIIILLITDAVLHMTPRAHKITLDENIEGTVYILPCAYICIITISYGLRGSQDGELLPAIYIMGRLGHMLGFCLFLCLLYSISHLAMYIVLPCLLWFVPAMFAPCCPCLWRGEPAWWNFVKKPQPTVDIV